ncbi:restriction endonuclease subunit S [Streptomyces sp. NPDC001758]
MMRARLPYSGGPTPGTWAIVPLKYLATLTNGYVFNSADRSDEGTPIIRIENLNGSPNFNCSTLSLPDKYRVEARNLLFSWSGNPGTSFGPYLWTEPGEHYLNQHIFKVGVHGCDPRWLYWALKAATHWIERELTSGMIGMVHVTKEDLAGVPIPVPPVVEQRRIAEFLDVETSRIDRLVSLRQKLASLLTERDKALRDDLIDKLFATQGEVPLRRVAQGIEQGASPQCEAVPREMGEWAVLKLSAVKQGVFNPYENKRLPDNVSPNEDYAIRPGDLLITRANTPNLVGDAAVVGEDSSRLLLPDLIYRVRLTGEMSAEFLMHVTLSGRTRSLVEAVARGSSQSMVKLRGEDIKSWPVPRASREQQAALVQEIERGTAGTQKLRLVIDQQVATLMERRQALITAAVTGQFDVSTASGRNVTEGASA